ncbi:S8 family serine peptidase [Deinococcus aquatilis]|uniref:S8 family serine peptidase n=1 Tax=Deinococcus aquatilis TaxID=519440 RepID=UPI00037595BC|nr:S8 family serine peptidase [Deinococcus aquatilis]
MFAASLSPQSSWADLVDGDAVPQDEGTFGQGASGHGTAVAGLALLVAPGVKLMPVRVLDAGGLGDASAVAGGIVWAADHGADVINISLGSDQLVEAVTQAVAYANSLGAVVVAAAGNAGREGLDFPAAQFGGSDLNLAVGSHGALGLKSAFSQYGGLSLMAPGEGLMAPAPQSRVAAWSGTSMAAPVAAGAAALALAQGRTPQAAVSRLQATARNADAQNVLYAGKLGAGTLDLNRLTQPE